MDLIHRKKTTKIYKIFYKLNFTVISWKDNSLLVFLKILIVL